MRRCCEEALKVLRRNKEFLLSIIEVLIHDPLYRWALTAKTAQQRQQEPDRAGRAGRAGGTTPEPTEGISLIEDSSEAPGASTSNSAMDSLVVNADAERALLRVRHKLDGLEEGKFLWACT